MSEHDLMIRAVPCIGVTPTGWRYDEETLQEELIQHVVKCAPLIPIKFVRVLPPKFRNSAKVSTTAFIRLTYPVQNNELAMRIGSTDFRGQPLDVKVSDNPLLGFGRDVPVEERRTERTRTYKAWEANLEQREQQLNEREAQLDAREEQIELREAARQEDLAVQLQRALVFDEMEQEAQAALSTAREWVVKARRRCDILKANREARGNNGTATATTSETAKQRTENETDEGRNKRRRCADDEDWDVKEFDPNEVKQEEQ
jgi:hypothetical protein